MNISKIESQELKKFSDKFDFSKRFKNRIFLITGSKGILGQGIIKWLLFINKRSSLGIRIYASTRNPKATPSYLTGKDPVTFCKFGEESKTIKNKKIDFIIHCAAPTENKYNLNFPYEASKVIIDETKKMIELCLEKKCAMIFISSEEIYGITREDKPIKETYWGGVDSLNLRSVYPLSKKEAELLCYSAAIEYNADIKIIRPTVIQGLFQRYEFSKIENEILRCVIEKRNLQLASNGLTKKCMIYALDAVAAIFFVLLYGRKGEAYNASNPKNFISVKKLAQKVFLTFDNKLQVLLPKTDTSVAKGYLPYRSFVPDITKLKQLGWRPLYSINDIYKIDVKRFQKKLHH